MSLKSKVLDALKSGPLTHAGIEQLIGKQEGFALGIAIAKMAVSGQIKMFAHPQYVKFAPVYSLSKKLPAGFKFTNRERELSCQPVTT